MEKLEQIENKLHGIVLAKEGDENYNEEVDDAICIEKIIEIEKIKTDRLKIAANERIEKEKIRAAEPKPKTRLEKICDFGKSWGAPIAAGLSLIGIGVHEFMNRKNLSDVTKFEETGSFRSTGFRKWIK
ncbi:MAG: hypothetical protein J6S67_23705 [Methanobrevibacter sp.]|nr:hypothetical protein [Methanobrevibacter sp.]